VPSETRNFLVNFILENRTACNTSQFLLNYMLIDQVCVNGQVVQAWHCYIRKTV
jgi:hypothetical protein